MIGSLFRDGPFCLDVGMSLESSFAAAGCRAFDRFGLLIGPKNR